MNGQKQLKILFITQNRTKRGGHFVLTNLVRELKKQGYDITLTAFKHKGEADFPDCKKLWQGLSTHIVKIPYLKNPDKRFLMPMKAAAKYLKKHSRNFDRIILDSWRIAHAAVKAGIISEKVFQLVQIDPEFKPEDNSKLWKAEVFSLLPRFPIRRIIVSNSLGRLLKRRYGEKGSVIELFIDDIFFQTRFLCKKRKCLRLISSAGSFDMPEKGLDFLLDQLKRFKKYPFELTLVAGEKIRRELKELPFKTSVTTANSPKEMASLMVKHDIYVNTSTKEAFCLALAEAMAVGMPSIALDSVGNRDYMDGKNGMFVKNPKDFLAGMEKMRDFELRRKMSKAAKASMKKYTLKKTVEMFKKAVDI